MTSTSFNVGLNADRASSKNDKKRASAPSDSEDESDEDYVLPSGRDAKDGDVSEEISSEDEDINSENTDEKGSNKGRRKRRKQEKHSKIEENDEKTTTKSTSTNVDELWKNFKNDCGSSTAAATAKSSNNGDTKQSEARTSSVDDLPKTKTVTQLFEFAGEAIEVQKEVPKDAPEPKPPQVIKRPQKAGLSSILGQIGKKNKLSVLEKSKLDWDSFKQQEGIAEDLQKHNKGRDGYLEKQDFLQRADLRQFEIEKSLRNSKRK